MMGQEAAPIGPPPAGATPDAGALPPGLEEALGLGGGGEPPLDEAAGPEKSPIDYLRDAIAALDDYVDVEEDDIDIETARRTQAMLQKLLAKDQQEGEAAMGTTPAHRHMAKVYGAPRGAQV